MSKVTYDVRISRPTGVKRDESGSAAIFQRRGPPDAAGDELLLNTMSEGAARETSGKPLAKSRPRRRHSSNPVPNDFIGKVTSGIIVSLRKNRKNSQAYFGFISIGTEEEKTTGPRIYFNATSFTDDTYRAKNGQAVSFKVTEDESGRLAACLVTLNKAENVVTTPHQGSMSDSKSVGNKKRRPRRRTALGVRTQAAIDSVVPSNAQPTKKESITKTTNTEKEANTSMALSSSSAAELAGKRPLLASEVPRVGCGCFLLSPDHPGKALFGRRKGSHGAGKYALPGGKLELDEEVEACIAREIKEEVNVDLLTTDVRQVGITNDRCMDGDKNKHYITIHCRAVIPANSSAVQNMEPNKCQGWEWKTFEEIHNMWQIGLKTGEHTLFEPTQRLLQSGKVDPNFWAHEL
jgi:ADP-ribose pyrophosphatase YjhB (NUDIX family)